MVALAMVLSGEVVSLSVPYPRQGKCLVLVCCLGFLTSLGLTSNGWRVNRYSGVSGKSPHLSYQAHSVPPHSVWGQTGSPRFCGRHSLTHWLHPAIYGRGLPPSLAAPWRQTDPTRQISGELA